MIKFQIRLTIRSKKIKFHFAWACLRLGFCGGSRLSELPPPSPPTFNEGQAGKGRGEYWRNQWSHFEMEIPPFLESCMDLCITDARAQSIAFLIDKRIS